MTTLLVWLQGCAFIPWPVDSGVDSRKDTATEDSTEDSGTTPDPVDTTDTAPDDTSGDTGTGTIDTGTTELGTAANDPPLGSGKAWYFSGCATGGSGTLSDPYCLDPDSDGDNDSFEYVMDVAVPDLQAGDTVFLCAGACDGSGSATWLLDAHTCYDDDLSPWLCAFDPVVHGTNAQPITVTPYCDEEGCETVALSGDSDGDGTYDAGEVEVLWVHGNPDDCCDQGAMGRDHYQLLGDRDGDGTPNLIFERAKNKLLGLNEGGDDVIVDGIEGRFLGPPMWPDPLPGDGGILAAGCDEDTISLSDYNAINVADQVEDDLSVRDSSFHHVCGCVWRVLNNCAGENETCERGATSQVFENNRVYNALSVFNGHQGRNLVLKDNDIWDFYYGIGVEEQYTDVLIEGNRLTALGEFEVGNDGAGKVAIDVNDGDADGDCWDDGSEEGICTTKNVIVRNNVVTHATGAESLIGASAFNRGGIVFSAHNSEGTLGDTRIENNVIAYVQHSNSCTTTDRKVEKPLSVYTNDPVIVQNNTVFYSRCEGIFVDTEEGTTDAVAHVVRNNLVVQSRDAVGYCDDDGSACDEPSDCGVGDTCHVEDYPEIRIMTSAVGSTIENNNFHPGDGQSNWVASVGSDVLGCGDVSELGEGNICARTTFVESGTADPLAWDLHLDATDTANEDAGGNDCAPDDVDLELRPSPCDIGADEVTP